MNVLFLALGAYRKRAVVEECREVVSAGGTATVVVASAGPWRRSGLPAEATLVDVDALLRTRVPVRVGQLIVHRGPRFVLRKVFRRRAKRVLAGYQKAADRFDRRVFLPAYRRVAAAQPAQLLARHLARTGREYDWIIVADSPSMPDAVRLGDVPGAPGIAYSVDHLPRTA